MRRNLLITSLSEKVEPKSGSCQLRADRHGFTLMELLVVISIIALLMSILVPALATARDEAKKVVCASNLKNNALAFYLYAEDFNGRLPDAWPNRWYNLLAPYLNANPSTQGVGVKWLRCPAAPKDAIRTYGGNHPGMFRYNGYYNMTGSSILPKIPKDVFLITDTYSKNWGAGSWYGIMAILQDPRGWRYNVDYDGDGIDDSCQSELITYGPYGGWHPRHRGGANFLYANSSVGSIKIKEFVAVGHALKNNPSLNNTFWGNYDGYF